MSGNFNGKAFKTITDFENEFRPTKWSIRKFYQFLKSLDVEQRSGFIKLAFDVIGRNCKDKESKQFLFNIEQMEEKSRFHKDEIHVYFKVRVTKGMEKEFVNAIGMLRKKGIIYGNATNLAVILKDNFKINRSESTIRDWLYKAE